MDHAGKHEANKGFDAAVKQVEFPNPSIERMSWQVIIWQKVWVLSMVQQTLFTKMSRRIWNLKDTGTCNRMMQILTGLDAGRKVAILASVAFNSRVVFDDLALATELGYAEADPTADIEGLDAGRKVAILASVAFNSRVVFNDVYTEGIAKITSKDIRYAKEMGRDIKLLGVARNTEDGIEAYVCPMLIPSSHPLATVNDSYNAVFVHGDAVEDAMFFGRGAGELPTASAVVGDIFDIVRNMLAGCCGRIGCTCYKEIPVKKMENTYNRYFLRLKVEDRCGVLAEMTAIFAKYQVSVAQIIQKDTKIEGCAEVVVITYYIHWKR